MSQIGSVLKCIGVSGTVAAIPLCMGMTAARAETLTAGVALDTMTSTQLSAYLQGIVEGMAQARYEKDGGTDGMRCIYEFYYTDEAASARTIIAAFDQYPDHSPGAVMSGLIQRECPG
jgi:hypothetical protein